MSTKRPDTQFSEAFMPTISLPERLVPQLPTPSPVDGPILVATDGTAQSTGAFAAAVSLSAGGVRRREHSVKLSVHVVTVCGALPIGVAEMIPALPYNYADVRRRDMLAAATEQIRYNVADTTGWQIEAAYGSAAPMIADIAAEDRASLVVMGLGRHDLADRVFGSETALRVIRQSAVPVLAVPQNWIGIPRRVLVAVDFGPASIRAAQTAMGIIEPGGSVCFAHVGPALGQPDHNEQLVAIYETRLGEELDRFIAEVGVPDDVTVTRASLSGETTPALLGFARTNNIDMIVAGTHGLNALARVFVGSVAVSLVRGAQCAVLIASAGKGATPNGASSRPGGRGHEDQGFPYTAFRVASLNFRG